MIPFEIGEKDFLLNGQKIRLISGAIHYFRIHPDLWEDRIGKLKLMGLNCLELYVAWNVHEPREGKFEFSFIADLERFIKIIQNHELLVIVRPGPYICAEWEFGGFPPWLLKNGDMKLRCSDKEYLAKVDKYFDVLIPKIAALQIHHGGPVIAVQVENEYGSYSNDKEYLRYLADGLHKRGIELPLFTSDGNSDFMLQYGTLEHVHKTVNFGSGAQQAFRQLRKYQKKGPLMCMEFWNGWFDHWGKRHHGGGFRYPLNQLKKILHLGASVNFYMAHGGTNFGFMNGANHQATKYQPTITSYDYNAPLSECGDITPKFRAFRKELEQYVDLPPYVEPGVSRKIAIEPFRMEESVGLFSVLEKISNPVSSPRTLSMEQVDQNYGFILYRTTLPGPRKDRLKIRGLHDRAMVFADGEFIKTVYRNDRKKQVPLTIPENGTVLDILVENMGRVNYGPHLFDRKGIVGDVLFGGQTLSSWEIYPLPLDNLEKLDFSGKTCNPGIPGFFRGTFMVDQVGDSFLSLPGWTKGVCWVNGFNLGRYWKVGPQKTLYVPSPLLKAGENEIVIFELHNPGSRTVVFGDSPKLG